MALTTGKVRIYWEERGDPDRPALLMIRGLSRTIRHWGPVLELLAPHLRLVLLDNRGVGHSDAPAPPYATADMADDVARVMDAAGVPRAHVLGISLGGMVAQQVALRHAARVDHLLLGCTRGGPRLGPRPPWRSLVGIARAVTSSPDRVVHETAPFVLSDRFVRERPEVLDEWRALMASEPPPRHGVIGQVAAALRHDVTRELGRIRAPTLVMTGTVDRLMPPECSEALCAAIPGARLALLGGAGHDFVVEQPEETAAAILGFVGAA